MQSISKDQFRSSVPSTVPQSAPTSPIAKAHVVQTKTSTGTKRANFFTFRWLFRGTKNTSKRKLRQINNKTKEKFATISSNTTKILLRHSYSFDDIQQFLISQQNSQPNNRSLNDKSVNICKSSVDINKSKRLSQIKCKLCLQDKSGYEMHSIWSCGCAFCKICLTQYCEMSIRDGKVALITCPDGVCPDIETKINLISAREIKLLVSSEMYETYKRYRLNWMIENDPTRTWCPTPNCETICYIKRTKQKDNKKSSKPLPVFCPTCNKTFCSSCRKNWHLGTDCKKLNTREDVLLTESSPIKRCPKCCILIERDEGCAQIMCRNCKHVFCWFCLASLEDDFLLRHYDKGQCKDKLGHSRASVIWHRTQVVGIFAGFGLLILLASPMFILAAPCLLCCRCSWYKSDEQDMNDEFDAIPDSDIALKSDSIL